MNLSVFMVFQKRQISWKWCIRPRSRVWFFWICTLRASIWVPTRRGLDENCRIWTFCQYIILRRYNHPFIKNFQRLSTLISFYDVQITQKHPNIIYYIFFKPYSPSQHKAKFALFYPLRCFIDHFAADNYTQCDMFIVDVREAFFCVFVCML